MEVAEEQEETEKEGRVEAVTESVGMRTLKGKMRRTRMGGRIRGGEKMKDNRPCLDHA